MITWRSKLRNNKYDLPQKLYLQSTNDTYNMLSNVKGLMEMTPLCSIYGYIPLYYISGYALNSHSAYFL